MKFELDIKTIVFICMTVASVCGIYYTTQNRVSNLEMKVETVENILLENATDIDALNKKVKALSKRAGKNKKSN